VKVSPEEVETVQALLTAQYPAPKPLARRKYEFQDNETYFVPTWTTVKHARLGQLEAQLQGVTVYQSSLYWMHFAPEEITVLVAVREPSGGAAITMSPDFAAPDDSFLELIAASYLPGNGDRTAFMYGLAEVFATITYEGEVRNATCDDRCCAAELWKPFGPDPRPWYRFELCFCGDQVEMARAEWMPPPSN